MLASNITFSKVFCVQTIIRECVPDALHVHSQAHSLNLAITYTVCLKETIVRNTVCLEHYQTFFCFRLLWKTDIGFPRKLTSVFWVFQLVLLLLSVVFPLPKSKQQWVLNWSFQWDFSPNGWLWHLPFVTFVWNSWCIIQNKFAESIHVSLGNLVNMTWLKQNHSIW